MEVNQAKLYDRQIQIFGADTQKNISSSEVFVYGLNTITSEIVKNLALIGFNVALYDIRETSLDSIQGSPLLGKSDERSIGIPIAQVIASKLVEMNPCIQVRVVTESPETVFCDNTKIFISACQTFEQQAAISIALQKINVPKFYVFNSNYKFIALAELPSKPFHLSERTKEQVEARLGLLSLQYNFSEIQTPSLDDFLLQCVFGATLNQTILSLITHNDIAYNVVYLDTDSQSNNPNHQRRFECMTLN